MDIQDSEQTDSRMEAEPGEQSDVSLCPEQDSHFLPWLAALSSRKIPYYIAYRENRRVIVVDLNYAEAAREELDLYEERNLNWPPPSVEFEADNRPLCTASSIKAALGAAVILAGIHIRSVLQENAWVDKGTWNAGQISDGEWWRVVTALTLHGDEAHLVSNICWMTGLTAVAGVDLGGGIAVLFALLSGVLGNMLMLPWGTSHTSLGASTMVFGVTGLLCSMRAFDAWRKYHGGLGSFGKLLPWSPLFAGVVMFAFYGTAPGTDMLAHACGLACGFLLGFPAVYAMGYKNNASVQLAAGIAAGALTALSWYYALHA